MKIGEPQFNQWIKVLAAEITATLPILSFVFLKRNTHQLRPNVAAILKFKFFIIIIIIHHQGEMNGFVFLFNVVYKHWSDCQMKDET